MKNYREKLFFHFYSIWPCILCILIILFRLFLPNYAYVAYLIANLIAFVLYLQAFLLDYDPGKAPFFIMLLSYFSYIILGIGTLLAVGAYSITERKIVPALITLMLSAAFFYALIKTLLS